MNWNPQLLQAVTESLSDDCECINLIDTQENSVFICRTSGSFSALSDTVGQTVTGMEFDAMLRSLISEEDFQTFLVTVNRDVLMPRILEGEKVCIPFRLRTDQTHHYVIEFAVFKPDPRYVVLAFRNVDNVISSRINLENLLEEKVRQQDDIISSSLQRLAGIQDKLIESMAILVESRDINTGNHIQNTRKYTELVIAELQKEGVFPELNNADYAKEIALASTLHDIGKIFISDMILNKPGKLSNEEFDIIRTHTVLGKEIVDETFAFNEDSTLVNTVADIVYGHHERWDGTGYPRGLAGEEIPLSARIMAVADVFDALVSKRSYKDPFNVRRSLEMIAQESGTHFDERIVSAFISIEDQLSDYLASVDSKSSGTSLSGAFSSYAESLQEKSIVSAFIADYVAACLCNPITGELRAVYIDGKVDKRFQAHNFTSLDNLRTLCPHRVHPGDLDAVLYALSSEGMQEIFAGEKDYSLNYMYRSGNSYSHRQLRMIKTGTGSDGQFEVLIGIRNIEEEVAKANASEACLRALTEDDVDAAVNTILSTICKFYNGDRAYIYTFNDLEGVAELNSEYALRPNLIKGGRVASIPLSILQSKVDYMYQHGVFTLSNTETGLSDEEKAAYHARMPQSLFIAPVKEKGKITGFWGVDNPKAHTDDLELLEDMVYSVSEALLREHVNDVLRKENQLIKALAKEYGAIYHINLVTRKVEIFGLDEIAKKRYEPIFKNPNFNLDVFLNQYYIQPDVVAEDQQMLRETVSVANVRKELKAGREVSCIFRVRRDGIHTVYTEAKVFEAEVTDGEVTAVVLAFKVVDDAIRKELERIQAVHMASHDGLTGLLNRVTYESKVTEYFGVKSSKGSAMAYLDLDLFKMVNDNYGHAEGDKILIKTAEAMKAAFSDNEFVCRIGGDEFSVFFPDADRDSVLRQLNTFRDILNERFENDYSGFRVTVSIGCAYCTEDGLDFNRLRILSDHEMYRVKVEGGNGIGIRDVNNE